VPARLGKADEIQPVARPALAVVRRIEQAVDDALERLRRLVGEEGIDFRRRRRKADEVEGYAPQERALFCGPGRFQSRLIEPGENETIDVAQRPGCTGDVRRSRLSDGLEGPLFRFALCQIEVARLCSAGF